ncbi:MAG: hypothetical protein J0I29_14580 [Rhizobiales bacterium]|nr:hypothetical protein [Hyphomicrobiales bacterium]
MKSGWRIGLALAGAAVSAAAFAVLLPHARSAGTLLMAQDDPAALSDLQMNSALRNDPDTIERNVDEALKADDADLAKSFTDLAADKDVPVAADVATKVDAAVTQENSTATTAKRFAKGLITGEADDVASLSGTVAGDLFVFGDIRDVIREGKRLAMGYDADKLVLGLATAGIAVTAATYVSAGGAVPVRAGLTMVKDARKVGRLGAGLTEWAGRSARGVVDGPLLQKAVADASLARPGQTVSAMKAAFKAEKAGALVRLAKDTGRVAEKAGTKGALDVLRIADGPADVARAATLAEKKGSQTRAIVKVLGRGALLLATGAFNLAWWVFGACLALLGFLASIKATTERLTYSYLQRKKLKHARRDLALAQNSLMAA